MPEEMRPPEEFTSMANPPVTWPRFTLIDVGAVNHAMLEAKAKAADKSPESSSRQALDQQAAKLRIVLDKLLDGFPDDVKARYGQR